MSNRNKNTIQKSLENSNKNTVGQRIKAMVEILWGTGKDIWTSLTVSFFVMSIIFLTIALQIPKSMGFPWFYALFCVHFALWLIFIKGADATILLASEFAMLLGACVLFLESLYYFFSFTFDTSTKGCLALSVLCWFTLCFSLFHFVNRIKMVLAFVKKAFSDFTNKISSSTTSKIAKTTELLEKMTSLLIAITALIVAIKGLNALFEALPYLINITGK